jgi:PTS system cellobiose-specific IIA component
MDDQQIVMQLIVNGGNARSKAMEAIQEAKAGHIGAARSLIEQAGRDLSKAHEVQTELIQDEANGNTTKITILLLHAQDHLMNAITVKDLAQEFIDLYQKLQDEDER